MVAIGRISNRKVEIIEWNGNKPYSYSNFFEIYKIFLTVNHKSEPDLANALNYHPGLPYYRPHVIKRNI